MYTALEGNQYFTLWVNDTLVTMSFLNGILGLVAATDYLHLVLKSTEGINTQGLECKLNEQTVEVN